MRAPPAWEEGPGAMAPRRSGSDAALVCTQLISRFDRNGERPITLKLLRSVRGTVRRRAREGGARGSIVWRLERTRAGITVSAFWHPDRDSRIKLALVPRQARIERFRAFARDPRGNRRRSGT